MLIYKITNTVNNKCYVGQTKHSLNCRKISHMTRVKMGLNRPLYNAIRKYGESSFVWEELETVTDISKLNERETFWITYHASVHPNGYNLMCYGNNGLVYADRTKDLMTRPRKPLPESTKNKISESLKIKYKKEGFAADRAAKISTAVKAAKTRYKSKFKVLCKRYGKDEKIYDYLADFCRANNVIYSVAEKWWSNKSKSRTGWTLERIPI